MISALLQTCICSTSIPCSYRFSNSSSNSYVASNCIFSQLIQSIDNGGAIDIIVSTANVSISSSLFYTCEATGSGFSGGAFCIETASLTLETVCGMTCLAAYYGQFAYTSTSTHQTDMISMSQCAPSTSSSYYSYTTFFTGGSQTLKGINSTQNYVSRQCPGFFSYSAQSSNVAMTNIANCSSQEICVAFTSVTSAVYELSNVFGNTFSGPSGVIFSYISNLIVQNCVVRENSGGPLFHLYTSSGSLKAVNCVISHGSTLFYNGAQSVNCSVGIGPLLSFTSDTIQTSGLLCIFPVHTVSTQVFSNSHFKTFPTSFFIYALLLCSDWSK